MPTTDCGFAGQSDFLLRRGPTLSVAISLDSEVAVGIPFRGEAVQELWTALVDTGLRNELRRFPTRHDATVAGSQPANGVRCSRRMPGEHAPSPDFRARAGCCFLWRVCWRLPECRRATSFCYHRPGLLAPFSAVLRWTHRRRHPQQRLTCGPPLFWSGCANHHMITLPTG